MTKTLALSKDILTVEGCSITVLDWCHEDRGAPLRLKDDLPQQTTEPKDQPGSGES